MKPRFFVGGPLHGYLLEQDDICYNHQSYHQFNAGSSGFSTRKNGKKHELKCIYVHESILNRGLEELVKNHFNNKQGETKL